MVFPISLRRWAIRLAILLAGTSSVSGQPTGTHATSSSGASPEELSETEVRLRRLYIRGLTRAELDDHGAAVELLTEALQLAPDDPAIAAAIATSYHALGSASSALHYAQRAVAGDPDNAFYQIQLARLYRATTNVEGAVSAYRAAIALAPRDEDSLLELAQILAASGEYRSAIEAYQRLLDIQGETLDVREQILNLYSMLDDSAGVRQTLELLIPLEPSRFEFRHRLSQIYVQQGKSDRAAALFEELLAADPFSIEAERALAEIRGSSGVAEPDVTATPDSPISDERALDPTLLAGAQPTPSPRAATARSNKDRAIEEADALARKLKSNPRDLDLWARTAQAYRHAGDFEKAYTILEEALLLFPGQPLLLGNAALTLIDLSRIDESTALLTEAIALLSEDGIEDIELRSLLLTGQAMVYGRRGMDDVSDSLFDEALNLDPRNSVALAQYAASLTGRSDQAQHALSFARQAAAIAPQDPAALHVLGHVYLILGDLQQAQTWLENAIEAGSVDARTFQCLGDVYERLGNMDRARHFWQESLDLDPNNSAARVKLK